MLFKIKFLLTFKESFSIILAMDMKDKLTVSKIDIDEKTAEPKIVNLSEKQLNKELVEQKKYDKYDFVEKKSDKSIGKQLVMKRLLGVENETPPKNKRAKIIKRCFTIFFVLFVFAVLAFTFYKDFFGVDEDRSFLSWEALKNIFSTSWVYLLLAVISLLCCYLLKGLKLSVMCKSMTKKMHFKTCLETGIIGHYYNNVTPLAVGGQPFEIYHLSKHGVKGGVATALPIATFFLNQFAFVALGVVSLIFVGKNPLMNILPTTFSVLATIGLICCAIMPTLVVIFSLFPTVGTILVNFVMHIGAKLKIVKNKKLTTFKTIKTVVHNSKCLKKLATRPLVFILSFVLSLFEHLSTACIAYFTLMFFGFSVTDTFGVYEWLAITQMFFILTASISFIPTPGNSGAADLSFFVLFETGLSAGLAFPAMVTWRVLAFYSYIIIGFVFATLKKKSDNRKKLQNKPL